MNFGDTVKNVILGIIFGVIICTGAVGGYFWHFDRSTSDIIEKKEIESISDVFNFIPLGQNVSSLPKKFIRESNNKYSSFIDGYTVNIIVKNNKTIKIRAEKYYDPVENQKYLNEWKKLRSEIFVKLKSKSHIPFHQDYIDPNGTSKTKYRQNPDRFCYTTKLSFAGVALDLIPSPKDESELIKMIYQRGIKSGHCDNDSEALKFGYDNVFVAENGSITIIKYITRN